MTLQWMWRDFPSCCGAHQRPSALGERQGGLQAPPVGRLAVNSFGLGSWRAKVTDIHSHALYFLCLFWLSSSSAVVESKVMQGEGLRDVLGGHVSV